MEETTAKLGVRASGGASAPVRCLVWRGDGVVAAFSMSVVGGGYHTMPQLMWAVLCRDLKWFRNLSSGKCISRSVSAIASGTRRRHLGVHGCWHSAQNAAALFVCCFPAHMLFVQLGNVQLGVDWC